MKRLKAGRAAGLMLAAGWTVDVGCFLQHRAIPRRHPFPRPSVRRFSWVHAPLSSYPPDKVAVVGGGLAGLATVYHLLDKRPDLRVTVFDRAPVGTGGASSVAGGLLHPLSPRGKLVHWGMEGLQASSRLIQESQRFLGRVQIRDQLIRLAVTEEQTRDLQATSVQLPNICQWLSVEELLAGGAVHESARHTIYGGVRLHNGCQVVHVPSYLEALWKICQTKGTQVEWSPMKSIEDRMTSSWKERLSGFDTVVLCCGDGLFQEFIDTESLPIQLVRGQSIEMRLPETSGRLTEGLLSGKYMSPLPDERLVLIGASHEFGHEPLPLERLLEDLRARTVDMAPYIWTSGQLERVTTGVRVQSKREKHGRRPIVGQWAVDAHPHVWLFTGLSSRGLLYHALYGEKLAEAILADSEDTLLNDDVLWWRRGV